MSCRNLLIFIGVGLCVCRQAPPIDFFKENVTIEVLNGRVKVTGSYIFRNLTDIGKRVKFYYPFPVDSNHHFPDTISIDRPYEKDSTGISFWLSLKPNGVDSFEITYEQLIDRPFFRYITTTTKVWKRPIKEANFTIVAPETLAVSANYAFSEPVKIGENLHYFIPISNFLPEEDLIVRW
jgi:hypothetical protein